MPTYEYECLSCGITFELFQKMSEPPLDKCVKCQGSVRRVVSGGTGVIFKGSGFYITDYGKKDKKPVSDKPDNKAKSSKSGTVKDSAKSS